MPEIDPRELAQLIETDGRSLLIDVREPHDVLPPAGVAARNLTGGIDRWSVEVDPSFPRY